MYFCFARGHGRELSKNFTNYGALYDYLSRILYGCSNTIYLLFAIQRAAVIYFPLETRGMFTIKSTLLAVVGATFFWTAVLVFWTTILFFNYQMMVCCIGLANSVLYLMMFVLLPLATGIILGCLYTRVRQLAKSQLLIGSVIGSVSRAREENRTAVVLLSIGTLHTIGQVVSGLLSGVILHVRGPRRPRLVLRLLSRYFRRD